MIFGTDQGRALLPHDYYADDSVERLRDGSEVLWVRSVAFCAGQGSTSFTADDLARFAVGMYCVPQLADELIDAGFWDRDGDGYRLVEWEDD